MRRDPRQLCLQFLRGMERRAAQHDRHPAADRRIGRQARQRIRPHHADQVGLDLQHFADHGRDQRLVALPRRRVVDGDGDEAQRVDHDAAGIHPGRGGVLFVEQRLEGGIGAARLQARGDADAGEHAGSAQPVALPFHRGEVDMREHLVHHGVIVAAVIGAAARDQIGKLVLADKVAAAHLDALKARPPRRPCRSRFRSRSWSAPGRNRAPLPAPPCWW